MVEKITLLNKNAGTSLPISMEVGEQSYLLSSVDWGAVESSNKSYKFIDQVGVYVTKTTLESRVITIIGWVIADTQKEMTRKKSFLNLFVNPMQRIDLIYDEYRIEGIPQTSIKYGKEMADNNEVMCKFMIDMFCPDPMFYVKDSSKVLIANWIPKFRFPLRIPKGGRSNSATTSTITTKTNGIKTISMQGTLNQPGTGDPSPTNIRPIYGAGQFDKKYIVTGSDIFAVGLRAPSASEDYIRIYDYTTQGFAAPNSIPFSDDIKYSGGSSYSVNAVGISKVDSSGRIEFIFLKSEIPDANAAKAYFNAHPLTVYYQSTSYPTATQVYCGLSITDANGYHGYAAGPTAPLYDGDTVDFATGECKRAKGYIASYVGEVLPGKWISDRDVYVAGATPTTGAQVVYELSTPTTETVPISEPITNAAGTVTLTFEAPTIVEYRVPGPNGIIMGLRSHSTIATLVNDGAMPCGMTITFQAVGELTNPKIVDINTQKYIQLNCTMHAGEIIEVSTLPNKKTVNKIVGETITNAFDLLDFENSTFLQLAQGKNFIRYDADTGLNNLSVTIGYDVRFLEVQK